MFTLSILGLLAVLQTSFAQLSPLETHVDTLDLKFPFNPVKAAYWTGLPHHRRTPFAVSPDGKVAYVAYLDASETDVHVISVDPLTFAAQGEPVTVKGAKEAGGLVAHNDGFALLTNIPYAGTGAPAPPPDGLIPALIRSSAVDKPTFLGGPDVSSPQGHSMSPDLNGDLVFSETAGLYGAYFVITNYEGDAKGHFGDSIQYIDTSGVLKEIKDASSYWGCSHNTGIAFEAGGDQPPFASICAEDHGSIWLNTATRGMAGKKIAGENTTNGASGEPMGGMSGSYSSLASFPTTSEYIFAWATRGCINLRPDEWLGNGNTQCDPRTPNHHVAISLMADKTTLKGAEAVSQAGAAEGDAQINWITQGPGADHSNIHAAAFDATRALVTWEEIAEPVCELPAFGCYGAFSGSVYQLVDKEGKKLGEPISSPDTYVAGDIVKIGEKLCWPYVSMKWDLSKEAGESKTTFNKLSFACVGAAGG